MGTTSTRTLAAEVLVRRVLGADGIESAVVRLRCPDCRRSLLLKSDAVREFLAMPLPSARAADRSGRVRGLHAARSSGPPSELPTATLADVMVRDVVCVRPETTIESLRLVLLERGISGAPVVNDEGTLVGVVTKTDLVRWDLDNTDPGAASSGWVHPSHREGIHEELGPGFHAEDIPGGLVGEIMTPLPVALPSHSTVLHASALMAYTGAHQIVVVDDAEVVGIVTPSDVLGWLARQFGWAVPRYTQSQRPPAGESS